MSEPSDRHAAEVDAQTATAAAAGQEAAILSTAGAREASVLATAGQRRINLIWELTQAVIAMAVTSCTLYVSGSLAIKGGADMSTFALLSNAFFLIIGFYFSRTNHQKTGGVGIGDEGR